MTVVAIGMVKDEADVVLRMVDHLLEQVDHVVVADNLSTDGTRERLHAAYGQDSRVLLVDDDEVGYYQSQKMTHLANVANREFGATWLVPFDADEWWYSPFGSIADVLCEVAAQWLVVPAVVYNHVTTDLDEPGWPDERIGWRMQTPLPLPKVACRWRDDLVIEQGNHGASYRGGATVRSDELLVVRHFPYRGAEQFIRKVRNGAAAYAAAGARLPESFGAHWRQWGQLDDEQLRGVYRDWYHRVNPHATSLDFGNGQGVGVEPLIYDPVTNL